MPASSAKVVKLSERTRQPHGPVEPRMRNPRGRAPLIANSMKDIPRNQRACRVRHPWPTETELEYDKPLPSSVRVTVVNGRDVLEETCPRCGKKRRQDMLSGRIIDAHAPYGYADPLDWVKLGEFMSETRRDFRRDMINSALKAGRS